MKELTLKNLLNGAVVAKGDAFLAEMVKDIDKRPGKGKRKLTLTFTMVAKDGIIDVGAKAEVKIPGKIDPEVFHTQMTCEEKNGQMMFDLAAGEPEDSKPVRAVK